MIEFLKQNIVTIIFGISTVVTSIIALRYKRLEHQRKVEDIVNANGKAVLFLSRPAMLNEMLRMYDRAEEGDCIWVQCVGCSNYSSQVRDKVLQAASKGVSFRVIVNQNSSSSLDLKRIYSPLSNAEIIEANDNTLRIQSLSEKEIILGLPGIDSYTGILIRDQFLIEILKSWYDTRFENLLNKQKLINN